MDLGRQTTSNLLKKASSLAIKINEKTPSHPIAVVHHQGHLVFLMNPEESCIKNFPLGDLIQAKERQKLAFSHRQAAYSLFEQAMKLEHEARRIQWHFSPIHTIASPQERKPPKIKTEKEKLLSLLEGVVGKEAAKLFGETF